MLNPVKPRPYVFLLCVSIVCAPSHACGALQVGASVVDVTPVSFPVLVNGGMLSRSVDQVKTRVNARAIVLDDGQMRLGIVVVDSCMMPRPFLDEVKQLATRRTQLQADRILISATHTHSAPASMSCLGTNADPTYVPYLREKIVQALVAAEANMEPARVGWAVADAAEYTGLRRWVRRPDRIALDPFGNPTVRANMHAAGNLDDVTGESGPEDPDLCMISFQTTDGRPIAVLANFSMHYFSGERGLSADYFGLFSEGLKSHLAKSHEDGDPAFVGIMSHGCSGDIWRRDYRVPSASTKDRTIESYANGLVKIALEAYRAIEYENDADLAMAEARLKLKYRVPDRQLLEWARRIVDAMGDRPPKDTAEVYAREQIILDQRQSTEVIVQAVRIGRIAIATTPNETYALTGLKLKLQSPSSRTMVIELANGGDGYIPPPEQHVLGGYNTWPARSAGLEIEAEPKITEAALGLLEEVAGRSRRRFEQGRGPASDAVLQAKPVAYWRLDELSGPRALDASGYGRDALYEPGVVFFLDGPRPEAFCTEGETNRAAHFAGGRLRARLDNPGEHYSVALSFWNGMPTDVRQIAGWMFSRDRDHGQSARGDHLGIGGKSHPGRLVFLRGTDGDGGELVAGHTLFKRWSWNQVVFVRDGPMVRVYLNGQQPPEIEIESTAVPPTAMDQFFFGGRSDNQSNWEGRLDEIAVFDRALSAEEIEQLAK